MCEDSLTFRATVQRIAIADQGITAIGIMAPVTNARGLVRNVDVIMSAVKVSSASLAVAGESCAKAITSRDAEKTKTARRGCVVQKVMDSLCANQC